MAAFTERAKDFFSKAEIDREALMDLLGEFLAVEQGGQKVYEKALTLVFNSEVRTKFEQYHKQTINHEKILTEVIGQLGGNPRTRSPGAKIAGKKVEALLRTMGRRELSSRENELNAMENIVLAQTKDHADWELLGKIVGQTADQQLIEVLSPAVAQVEGEADEHLNWTSNKLGEMQMRALSKAKPYRSEKRSRAHLRTTTVIEYPAAKSVRPGPLTQAAASAAGRPRLPAAPRWRAAAPPEIIASP